MPYDADYVKERFREAYETLGRLPEEKVRGYFSSWPDYLHEVAEILQQEAKRFRLGPPLPEKIDEMYEVLRFWEKWIEPADRRIVVMRAMNIPWRPICEKYGRSRRSLTTRHDNAIQLVVDRLNNGRRR